MKKTLTKKDLANTINNKLGYSKEEAKSSRLWPFPRDSLRVPITSILAPV